MRFSGHETFACRYPWLPKAYRAAAEDESALADDEQAMVLLGVGKNMIRSIRFWVEVMGVATRGPGGTFVPTAFGRAIFADDGFDPFLEDARTLWLLHWNVATRIEDPLFAWDYLLYKWPYAEVARSEALAALMREAQRLNLTRSEVTLGLHLDVFFHTYIPTRTAKSGFEDSLDCPLADLELLQQVGERRGEGFGRREPVYAFRREAKPEVTAALFEYCLDDYWRHNRPSESTLAYRDVAIAPRSVGQVFKLPEDDVRGRLDRYAGTDASLPFRYQPSAVQGLVSRRNEMESDFLALVYGREASSE